MMQLLQSARSVIAIQLYWASIVFIGWAAVGWLTRRTRGTFVYKWQELPVAVKLVIATAVSFAMYGVFTALAYALALPAWTAVLFYVAGFVAAGVYTYRTDRSYIAASTRALASSIRDIKVFSPLGILMALIVIELFLSLFIGGFMGGDAFIHVSKIRHVLGHGFTFTDAYYGTAPETRHTVSVLHTLMVVPSWFGIDPIAGWYASGLFFKLIKIAAVFYLAWRLLFWARDGLRVQYAALVSILSLALFNNYFISYPTIFVGVWIILFTIALFDIAERRNIGLLIISSILIAVTHPLAAIACAMLLTLVVAALVVFDRTAFTKRIVLSMAASMVLLLSTPLFTSTLPNQMTDAVRNFAASDFSYYSVLGHQALRPDAVQYFTTDAFGVMPWPLALVSALGIAGLFVFIKDRRYRLIIGAMVLFVPLILYNPVAYGVLVKQLPVWAITRFPFADQLTILTPLFGLLLICVGINKLIKPKIAPAAWLPILTAAALVIFVLTQTLGAVDPQNAPHASMYAQQKSTYGVLQNIATILPDDNNAVVLAERTQDSFYIPVVAPLRVVAINETNSTPAADMVHRSACYDKLYQTLDPALLKQANVSYVLADYSEAAFYNLALQNPTLTLIKQNDSRALFRFDGSSVTAAHDPACIFNE